MVKNGICLRAVELAVLRLKLWLSICLAKDRRRGKESEVKQSLHKKRTDIYCNIGTKLQYASSWQLLCVFSTSAK